MGTCTLGILSDIHYAGAAEQARGQDFELRGIANPAGPRLRRPLSPFHLAARAVAQEPSPRPVRGTGRRLRLRHRQRRLLLQLGLRRPERRCRLRERAGMPGKAPPASSAPACAPITATMSWARFTMFGGNGGMRLASWRRAQEDLALTPFWQLEIGRYVLLGVRLLAGRPAGLRGRNAASRAARMGAAARRTSGRDTPRLRRLATRPARPALLPRSRRPCPSSGATRPSAPGCRRSSRPRSAICTPTSSCGKAACWPGCPPSASSATPSGA